MELIRFVHERLAGLGGQKGSPSRSTYQSWLDGEASPYPGTAGAAIQHIWTLALLPENRANLAEIKAYLAKHFPNAPVEEGAPALADWFRNYVALQRQSQAVDKARPIPLQPDTEVAIPSARSQLALHEPPIAADPVVAFVDRLFTDAGFTVTSGCALVDSQTQVPLEPLYRYIRRLQHTATIPNYFPGVPEIPLDELFVELSAAEDLRGDIVLGGGPDSPNFQGSPVTLDPIRAWRVAANQKRLPLETVISRTTLRPAVLFGDPGSGKSTLLLYALHALARGGVRGTAVAAANMIPFRISLREFARDGADIGFQILQYLIRKELAITDETELEGLRFLLSHFFSNERPFRLFLLIDGIDEVTPDADAFGAISERLSQATSIAQMLFSSRRSGFVAPVRHYTAYELLELSEPAIHGLINNWFGRVFPRTPDFIACFIQWIFADPSLHEMAANPSLLSLLCFLNQNCVKNAFIQARNRTELYEIAVSKLVQDLHRPIGASLHPSLNTLYAFALDRYASLGTSSLPVALFSREELRQFLARLPKGKASDELNHSLTQLDDIWLRTRLVSRWNLGEWYHFMHLTFQEFFAARCLVTLSDAKVGRLIRRYRYNPYWQEVWRFYSGLRGLAGPSGRGRFLELAKAFLEPKDLFDQTLFLLAPLCAEFRGVDIQRDLKIDLSERLHDLVREGHNQSRKYIRRMVDVNPGHFLRRVKLTLTPIYEFYLQGIDGARPDTDPGEVRLAVQILECIYHEDALAFHRDLIRSELGFRALRDSDLALGPKTPSGRNEALRDFLEEQVKGASGNLQLHRGIEYLACVRDPQAAKTIFEVAKVHGESQGTQRLSKRRETRRIDDPGALRMGAL